MGDPEFDIYGNVDFTTNARRLVKFSERFHGTMARSRDLSYIETKIEDKSRYTFSHAIGKLKHLKTFFGTESDLVLFLKAEFEYGVDHVTGLRLKKALYEEFNLNKEEKKMSTEKSNTPNMFNLALTMIPEMKFYGVVADFQKSSMALSNSTPNPYTYCSLLKLNVGDKVLVLMGGKLAKGEVTEIQKETVIDVFAAFNYGMIESTIDCKPALDAETAAKAVIEILENARREQATRSAKQLILNQLGIDETMFALENLTGGDNAEG